MNPRLFRTWRAASTPGLRWLALLLALAGISSRTAFADCTLTNLGFTPLDEMGFNSYSNSPGGLYPDGANTRPPAHEAAGLAIAQAIQPLDVAGNTDTNQGTIVLLSLGLSNTTQEWATKGSENFTIIATNDPSLNPRVRIVDGAIGGQDAPLWTNLSSVNWNTVLTQRLPAAGVTTNQVQAVWLMQALAHPVNYGAFPAHARALQEMLEIIVRNAKTLFPNLKIAYVSSRARAYTDVPDGLNPEPFAYEGGFATSWLIADQIVGTNRLNYDSTSGPVQAPWLSWGPYLWADGTVPRGDGFTWLCSDLENDFTHPSATGGVPKVAQELLAFFKTDPTATPWFLKKNAGGPSCAPTVTVTNGVMPLAVKFFANSTPGPAGGHDFQWTFDDGEFANVANPAKTFPAPGTYHARLTVTDNNGNTTNGVVTVNVNAQFDLWRAAKFTTAELADPAISGAAANPDGDSFPNLLEYAMALDPKTANPAGTVSAQVTNGVFQLSFPHYKPATDAPITVEVSSDLKHWSDVTATPSFDSGIIETLTYQETAAPAARFFRLQCVPH